MNSEVVKNHRVSNVWKKSVELTTYIYYLTEKFSKNEIYGSTSQPRIL